MPIQTDSLNRKLYDLLNTRGYNPVPKDSDVNNAGKTVPPEEADVFKFTFTRNGEEIDDCWVTVDKAQNLIVYYDQDVMKNADQSTAGSQFNDSWFGLLNHLKKWAHSRQLSFKLEPKEKLDNDMAQRTYMKKKEQIAEGYYPMGKQSSYSDAIPTVKIILQHSRQVQEGEQRYRNVAKIFLENQQGERILSPTNKPGLAQIYARHLAEGGVPNDERWNHLKSLCEEYTKMAGFARAVKNGQFNESAQKLVEAGVTHFLSLRESLGKMRGHRGYNAYFESWTPALMETEGDESTNINELFVQETLDPRIESVMPILSKLSKNLGEMKEIDELAEWADKLIEGDGGQDALNPIGIPESEDVTEGMDPEKRARLDDLIDQFRDATDPSDYGTYNDPDDAIALIRTEFGDKVADQVAAGADKMHFGHHPIQRSDPLGWKKYRGKNRVTKAGKLFKQDSDYLKNTIKSRYKLSGKSATEGVEEGEIPPEHRGPKPSEVPAYLRKSQGKNFPADLAKEKERNMSGPEGLAALKKRTGIDQGVAEGRFVKGPGGVPLDRQGNPVMPKPVKIAPSKAPAAPKLTLSDVWRKVEDVVGQIYPDGDPIDWLLPWFRKQGIADHKIGDILERAAKKNGYKDIYDYWNSMEELPQHGPEMEGVAEDLDSNQKRVGQLGPTEKVKNNNIGKLVGANESVELSEMDKSQPSSDRGGESSGDPYAKGGKATPIKADKAKKDFAKILQKSVDKHNKGKQDTDKKVSQHVKEGQEDLEAILRIIRK